MKRQPNWPESQFKQLLAQTVENLTFHADNSGTAVVFGKRTKANRSGKREVDFDVATGRILATYLDATGLTSGPLWPGPRGSLTGQGIYRVVKQAIDRAGLADVLQGPHDLRRAFATTPARYAGNNAVDGDLLRRQMGHTTYRMTSDYTLLDGEDIRQRLKSPLALLNGD